MPPKITIPKTPLEQLELLEASVAALDDTILFGRSAIAPTVSVNLFSTKIGLPTYQAESLQEPARMALASGQVKLPHEDPKLMDFMCAYLTTLEHAGALLDAAKEQVTILRDYIDAEDPPEDSIVNAEFFPVRTKTLCESMNGYNRCLEDTNNEVHLWIEASTRMMGEVVQGLSLSMADIKGPTQ